MQNDVFEISIEKDFGKDTFDKHNASKKALHAFKVFVQSLDDIVTSEFKNEIVECDLGTDKLAIKASEDNIKMLNKWIQDYRDHKLKKQHKAYKALEAIEKVFTENGLTYKAIIRNNGNSQDLTPVFKKEKTQKIQKVELAKNELGQGLHFLYGKITSIQAKRKPFYMVFEIDSETEYKVHLSSESLYKLNGYIDSTTKINIICNTLIADKGKIQNWFFDHFTDEEIKLFLPFYDTIEKLDGTEKLKFIYRFFNKILISDELSKAVKFAKVFLLKNIALNSFNVQRMILDVLKKVSDEEQIKDIYNEYIDALKNKLGKSIY